MSEKPYVSVICPVYNDPEGIRQTLEALVDQSYRNDQYEILVVDNNSTDRTPSVVEKYTGKSAARVHLLFERAVQSSYAARNKAVCEAQGEYVLFIDSDMTVEHTWIEDTVRAMKRHKCRYMGSQVSLYMKSGQETIVGKYNAELGFPVKSRIANYHYAPTCCLSVTRDIFDEVGLFDASLVSGGDYEFGTRVHDAGIKQCYGEDVWMYHPARTTWQSLAKKKIRTTRGIEALITKYPERFAKRGPLHLRNFLPPNPSSFKRIIKDPERYSTTEMMSFYLISYTLKLVGAVTRVQYRLGQR